MNSENQINREQFEAWLFSQPDGRVFNFTEGLPNDQTGCVMCNFLREQTNMKDFCVGTLHMTNSLFTTVTELPKWFIDMMDLRLDRFISAKEVKSFYLTIFPNAIVGNNDIPANAGNLPFNSIASVTESNATNMLNSPSKLIK